MKKLFLVILLVAFSSTTAFSQVDIEKKPEENLITIAENEGFTGTLEQQLKNLKAGSGQAAVIKQIGDHNHALIKQHGANLFVYILQEGDYLDATLIVQGSNNNAITKQRGDHLLTDVKLVGSNNDFKLLQAGSNLSNKVRLLNVTGMDVVLLQTEGRFLYSQNGSGNGIPLTIKTSQSMPTIIITNN